MTPAERGYKADPEPVYAGWVFTWVADPDGSGATLVAERAVFMPACAADLYRLGTYAEGVLTLYEPPDTAVESDPEDVLDKWSANDPEIARRIAYTAVGRRGGTWAPGFDAPPKPAPERATFKPLPGRERAECVSKDLRLTASYVYQPGDMTRYEFTLARCHGGILFAWTNHTRTPGARCMILHSAADDAHPSYIKEKMGLAEDYDALVCAQFLTDHLPGFKATQQ